MKEKMLHHVGLIALTVKCTRIMLLINFRKDCQSQRKYRKKK